MAKSFNSSFKLSAIALSMVLALTGCAGDDGDDGATGAQGPVGAQGPQGDQGAPGQDGQDGAAGQDGQDGAAGQDGQDGAPGDNGIAQVAGLVRLATVPTGAEVTGAYVTPDGDLFFNFQHPDEVNDVADRHGKVHNRGGVGVVEGVNVNMIPKNAISTPIPVSDAEKETVQVAYGQYKILAQFGDDFGGNFADGIGKVYGANGAQDTGAIAEGWPDFNGFIPTAANEGYLFTQLGVLPGWHEPHEGQQGRPNRHLVC